MSVENHDQQLPVDQSGISFNSKRSLLNGKTFLVDIMDEVVSSKVKKLIHVYGGKIFQTLKKTTHYLIMDKVNHEPYKTINDIGIKNIPFSNYKKSSDLINKANLLNIKVLSAKQFQQWLKTLLKQYRLNKNSTDKVANILKGKISLKIESLDQGNCPVFEFIRKWPDLGDTLCKSKSKIPVEHNFSGYKSDYEYNSSDPYSTSEIGGMCELCDIPFMNYKEHINTKTHIYESQNENKFHELDELINERPLNVIFNHFVPDKKTSEDQNSDLELSCVENNIKTSPFNVVEYFDGDKVTPCSFVEENPIILNEQVTSKLSERNGSSDTVMTFVPQKRPCSYSLHKEVKLYKKTKRKHKIRHKSVSKDIYKVEFVNKSDTSNLTNDLNTDKIKSNKPPVIIRLKRVKCSKMKNLSIDENYQITSENHRNIPVPVYRHIPVVRKQSFSNQTVGVSSKNFSNNHIFTFEQPKLNQNIPSVYYPVSTCVPYTTNSYVEHIKNKIIETENINSTCSLLLKESIRIISNMKSQKIGEWFHDIPKKIEDELSFEFNALIPITELSKQSHTDSLMEDEWFI